MLYRVRRSTISAEVRQVTPLLANRGFATPTEVRLHTLTDVLACAAAEELTVRLDGTEIRVRRRKANRPGRRAFVSGKRKQNTTKATIASDAQPRGDYSSTPTAIDLQVVRLVGAFRRRGGEAVQDQVDDVAAGHGGVPLVASAQVDVSPAHSVEQHG